MTTADRIARRAQRNTQRAPSFVLSDVPAVRLAQLRALLVKQVITKQQAAKLFASARREKP